MATPATSGGLIFKRCPKAYLRDAAAERALFVDWMRLHAYHLPPVSGGADEQPREFWDAASEFEDVLAKARRAKQRQGQDQAELRRKLQALAGVK